MSEKQVSSFIAEAEFTEISPDIKNRVKGFSDIVWRKCQFVLLDNT